jgi:hypothetical protein
VFEGNFMERIAPGAFKKTIKENRDGIGAVPARPDPQIGDKPLGPDRGDPRRQRRARYEVPLLDTSYNRDLLPGLKAGLRGQSSGSRSIREDFKQNPGVRDEPEGAAGAHGHRGAVMEFGPVTFPASTRARQRPSGASPMSFVRRSRARTRPKL